MARGVLTQRHRDTEVFAGRGREGRLFQPEQQRGLRAGAALDRATPAAERGLQLGKLALLVPADGTAVAAQGGEPGVMRTVEVAVFGMCARQGGGQAEAHEAVGKLGQHRGGAGTRGLPVRGRWRHAAGQDAETPPLLAVERRFPYRQTLLSGRVATEAGQELAARDQRAGVAEERGAGQQILAGEDVVGQTPFLARAQQRQRLPP